MTERDALVAFERATETRDASNQPRKTWEVVGEEWAQINYGTGSERRAAAGEQGTQAATFQVLDNAMTRTTKLSDRINEDGLHWDITSNVPALKDGYRDITAVRAA